MQQVPLSALRREGTGKSVTRKLRAQGQVPAIMYGTGQPAENLVVAVSELDKVIREAGGSTAFLSLTVEQDAPRTALLKEIQTDHLGRKVLHVDFYEVRADQKLTIEVPINFLGDSPGGAQGGVVSFVNHTITVEGVVADIPDSFDLDIGELEIDQALYLRDLEMPSGVVATVDESTMLVSCSPPALVVEEEEELEEGEEGEGEEAAEEEKSEESSE